VELPDNVSADEKSRRLTALQSLQKQITSKRLQRLVGRSEEVLIEGRSRANPNQLCGRTGGNHTVNIEVAAGVEVEALIGTLRPVQITAAKVHTLVGALAS
jgi:tRNA-2-methylthio-N6-dimethylallyladenosine synthase